MVTKQQRREELIAEIDRHLDFIKAHKATIESYANMIEGEWVIRKRWVKSSETWGGKVHEGHELYAGNITVGPGRGDVAFIAQHSLASHVKMFKSPRDAVFVAECLAGKASDFERQTRYVIEVVDRLDGEVYETIEKPWRFKHER